MKEYNLNLGISVERLAGGIKCVEKIEENLKSQFDGQGINVSIETITNTGMPMLPTLVAHVQITDAANELILENDINTEIINNVNRSLKNLS